MGAFLMTFCLYEIYLFVCLRGRHFLKIQMNIVRIALLNKRFLEDILNNYGRIFYHLTVAALSAMIALSLPTIVAFVAKNILVSWAMISNEKLFLISVEMVLGILLILLFNFIGRNWKDRRISRMAKTQA